MNNLQNIEQTDLNLAIIDSVAADNFTDIGADTAEVLLDALTDLSSTLESVPVIGTAVKLFRAGLSIKETLFLRKLGKFLLQLNKIPAQEREDFVNEMNEKPKFKKEVGEKLIIVLDRFDDVEKARLLGLLFQSLIRKELHYERFGRYAGILDRAYLPDLKRLKDMGVLSENGINSTLTNFASVIGCVARANGSCHLPFPTPLRRPADVLSAILISWRPGLGAGGLLPSERPCRGGCGTRPR